MGPGFVHPGNTGNGFALAGLSALQWGPGLYTREMGAPGRPLWGAPGFNGARVCTPGKYEIGAQLVERPDLLQWGPGLYTREIR